MRIAIVLSLLAALVVPATAGKRAGVEMPDRIQVAGKQLTLNGMGLREATMLNVDVYVAGLYLEKVSSDAAAIIGSNQTKVLVLHFVRDIDRGKIVEALRAGFEHNATVDLATIQGSIERLVAATPDFKKGDTLMFTYVPGKGVTITLDGVTKGTINQPGFETSLFSIWLGARPPNKGLKTGLLGKHGPTS